MAFTSARQTLEIGRVVSMTASVIRRRLPSLIALSLVFYSLPVLALRIGFQRLVTPHSGPGITIGTGLLLALVFVGGIIAGAVLQGAVTPLVRSQIDGGNMSFRAAMAAAFRSVPPLASVGVIFGLSVILGLFILIIPGLVLAAWWCVAAPALAAENGGVRQALGRSRALTKGNRWRIMVLIVLNYGLAIAVGLAIQRAQLALVPLNLGASSSYAFAVIASAADSVIATTGAAVLYAELRRVHDGVGLASLGAVFD